ncbi:glucose-methanol-choline (gmc) oxidoreductase, putative [Metarhizium acridum CQMa 102]|uniref:Glucose-methanol-choline (Gmc) oxidoreductase, putative n=1 Tax=Metarhizium acridum (strain CQMa 102) TaxID=655827 RepID=E9EC29_METAQ|nr:glucose-methanol-choline (gmc) oxidoreductase, putative [Metarhizium acridum CQMa 102]EFY86565.1 glucose-methanol-choline (gmc) oxidoreductase, putative [Metarhizium acridum CQMa 102]
MTMDPRQPENSAILTTVPSELAEVDFIIARGGTAGSIVAARLSDAHPQADIPVIKAGPESFHLAAVAYPAPALYRKNISPASSTIKFYFAAPDTQLANKSIPILASRTLGGGSTVNLLMYARGQKADFNGWKEKGWSAEELVPFLQKASISCRSTPPRRSYRLMSAAVEPASAKVLKDIPVGQVPYLSPEELIVSKIQSS